MKAWPSRLKAQEAKYYDVAHTESATVALKALAHVAFFTNKRPILPTVLEKTWPQRAIR